MESIEGWGGGTPIAPEGWDDIEGFRD